MTFQEMCKFIEYLEHQEIDLNEDRIAEFLVKYENLSCPMPNLWR